MTNTNADESTREDTLVENSCEGEEEEDKKLPAASSEVPKKTSSDDSMKRPKRLARQEDISSRRRHARSPIRRHDHNSGKDAEMEEEEEVS